MFVHVQVILIVGYSVEFSEYIFINSGLASRRKPDAGRAIAKGRSCSTGLTAATRKGDRPHSKGLDEGDSKLCS